MAGADQAVGAVVPGLGVAGVVEDLDRGQNAQVPEHVVQRGRPVGANELQAGMDSFVGNGVPAGGAAGRRHHGVRQGAAQLASQPQRADPG